MGGGRPGLAFAGGAGQDAAMMKVCIFGGTTVFSYAFWAIGEAMGCSFFTSFMLSGVGSVVGVWVGWKIARRYG